MRAPHPSGLLDDHLFVIGFFHGERIRTAVPAMAARNGSLDARHLLARAALGDAGTLDELLAAARSGDVNWLRRRGESRLRFGGGESRLRFGRGESRLRLDGNARWRRRRGDVRLLCALAQTIALQDRLPEDRADALALFDLIRRAYGGWQMPPSGQAWHTQLAFTHEGPGKARRLLRRYWWFGDPVRGALDLDLRNPFTAQNPVGPWLAGFRALLPQPGVSLLHAPATSESAPSKPAPSKPARLKSPPPNPVLSESALSESALSESALSEPALSEPALSGPALFGPALSEPAPSRLASSESAPFEPVPFRLAARTNRLNKSEMPDLVAGGPLGVPFDRVTAPAVGKVEAPHRISVVVTAFRPGRELLTAVRSILEQSWANVEIILVDDASPPEYDELLAEAAALGERIMLVKLAENAGTYAARNAGVEEARGEFVTFQDAADWSHPRRLELQVRPLIEDRRLVATTADALVVTDEFVLTRPGTRAARFDPSSLLFRRAAVTREIGGFDPVREGADGEYIGRMGAAFGVHKLRHLIERPLVLKRFAAGSDVVPAAYVSAYQRRHQLIAAGAVPAAGYAQRDGEREFDLVVVADWRFLESTQRTAVDELVASAGAGLRVAVLQLDSYRAVHQRRLPFCAPVQDLVDAGTITRVELGDEVTAGLMLVRQAGVLQFTHGLESRIRARRAAVIADRAPARPDGTDRRYLPSTCGAAVRRLFGADPVWIPQDAGVRAAVRTVDAGLTLATENLPAIVADPGWVADRDGIASGPPVAGVDLGDTPSWPPDIAAALAICHHSASSAGADIRVRLPDRPRGELPVPLPGEWLAYEPADLGTRPFLHQLDFYLHFPSLGTPELFARPALEAAAVGCVVLTPERFAPFYGDAAVYCDESEVAPQIARFRADPFLYASQSRRARQTVAAAHNPAAFVTRIHSLLAATPAS